MNRVSYSGALRLALSLMVLHQETGARAPLELNEEQVEVLRDLLEHGRCVVLKGRQVGISTVCCLHDLLFAVVNPGSSVAIVADTDDKAKGLLAKCAQWARQIGAELIVDNAKSIQLANGSTIDALSAVATADDGESRVGRSKSYALIHASELAFWRNAGAVFSALTSTALTNAKIVIESTGTPAEGLFRSIWDDGKGWHHVFLGVERHAAYRTPPESITDEDWAKAQSDQGFERRDSAAWWLNKLRTDFAGDVHRCLREYPVRPEHAFAFAEGRWIHRFTAASPRVEGPWELHVERGMVDEPLVFGVDTATGAGKDASTIAIRGQRTRRLIASFHDRKQSIPQFARTVLAAIEEWSPVAVVIEVNGVGASLYQLVAEGEPDTELHKQVSAPPDGDGDGEKWLRMSQVKLEIESGLILVGPQLKHEVLHSVIRRRSPTSRTMVYSGPDDMLNALSFAGKWLDGNVWTKADQPVDRRAQVSLRALREQRNGRGFTY